jgi:transcriptional regulator of acetoin/glycerol metabolism
MEAAGGDVRAATEMLGMSRATLYRRLAKMRPEREK